MRPLSRDRYKVSRAMSAGTAMADDGLFQLGRSSFKPSSSTLLTQAGLHASI